MNEKDVQTKSINPASLEALSKDLEALKTARAGNARERHAPSAGASRAAVDFISALAVCSLIGYGVDYWLDTIPLGLLVGLLAGAGVGAKLMIRDMKRDS
jgi:F0F1-type ATP synthase assembly protein I